MSSKAVLSSSTHANAAPPRTADGAPSITATSLENLAARFRPSGLLLALLQTDGTIQYHDRSACPFFERYVLPLLNYRQNAGDPLRGRIEPLSPASPISVRDDLPGLTLAAL